MKKMPDDKGFHRFQFIKNFNGGPTSKPFRKYNIIEGWFNGMYVVHYTEMNIHFIPEEYVKLYRK